MTDTKMTTKTRKSKAKVPKLFPDELIDQLLAQSRIRMPDRFWVNPAGGPTEETVGRAHADCEWSWKPKRIR